MPKFLKLNKVKKKFQEKNRKYTIYAIVTSLHSLVFLIVLLGYVLLNVFYITDDFASIKLFIGIGMVLCLLLLLFPIIIAISIYGLSNKIEKTQSSNSSNVTTTSCEF